MTGSSASSSACTSRRSIRARASVWPSYARWRSATAAGPGHSRKSARAACFFWLSPLPRRRSVPATHRYNRSRREDEMRLGGKVALVTGGARGMGQSEAEIFSKEGATVVVADVLETEGRKVADSLGEAGRFVRLDVTSEAAWQEAI